jgi:hypothetical protein
LLPFLEHFRLEIMAFLHDLRFKRLLLLLVSQQQRGQTVGVGPDFVDLFQVSTEFCPAACTISCFSTFSFSAWRLTGFCSWMRLSSRLYASKISFFVLFAVISGSILPS